MVIHPKLCTQYQKLFDKCVPNLLEKLESHWNLLFLFWKLIDINISDRANRVNRVKVKIIFVSKPDSFYEELKEMKEINKSSLLSGELDMEKKLEESDVVDRNRKATDAYYADYSNFSDNTLKIKIRFKSFLLEYYIARFGYFCIIFYILKSF